MTYWPREVLIYKDIFEKLRAKELDFNFDTIKFDDFEDIQILGLGKAAPFMVGELYFRLRNEGLENQLKRPIVFTKYAHAFSDSFFDSFESGHPLCDKNSFVNGEILKNKLVELESDDLLIVCLSGGASSLVEIPIPLFSPEEICQIHCDLLLKGVDIISMNQLRSEFSQIKNGGLASLSGANTILTYAINDIPISDIHSIGSGPTLLRSSSYDSSAKLATTFLTGNLLEKILGYLESSARENFLSMKEEILLEKSLHYFLVEDYFSLKRKVEDLFKDKKDLNFEFSFFDEPLWGDLDEGIEKHLVKMKNFEGPFVLFSGGELTFEVKGNGKGGRNTEFVLRLGKRLFKENALDFDLAKLKRLTIASVGTDGTDGVTTCAGAWMNYESYKRAKDMELEIDDYLERSDSFSYFEKIQTLIYTGPTETNLMDLRYIALN